MSEVKQISNIEKYLTIAGKGVGIVLAAYGLYQGIYKLGFEEATKQNSNDELVKTVSVLNKTVKDQGKLIFHFDSTLTVHLIATKKQEADFGTLEKSHTDLLKIVNRVDEIVKYYELKAENEKKNVTP